LRKLWRRAKRWFALRAWYLRIQTILLKRRFFPLPVEPSPLDNLNDLVRALYTQDDLYSAFIGIPRPIQKWVRSSDVSQ
jgi:hypothetical protein